MTYEPTTFCEVCGDPFDVYRAPDERVCESCAETAGTEGAVEFVAARIRALGDPE